MKKEKKFFAWGIRYLRRAFGLSFSCAPKATIYVFLITFVSATLPYISSKLQGDLVNQIVNLIKNAKDAGFDDVAVATSVFIIAISWAGVDALKELIQALTTYIKSVWRFKFKIFIEKYFLQKNISFDLAQLEDPDYQNLYQKAFVSGRSYWPIFDSVSELNYFVSNSLTLIVGIFIVGSFSWTILAIIIVTAIPEFYYNIKFGRREHTIWGRDGGVEQRRYFDYRSYLRHKTSIIESRIYNSADHIMGKVNTIYEKTINDLQGLEKSRFKVQVFTSLLSTLGFGIAIVFFAQNALHGLVSVGSLVFIISSINRLSGALNGLLTNLSEISTSSLYLTDLFTYLDLQPLVKTEFPMNLSLAHHTSPEIVFRNVSFKYKNADKYTLKNINITIPAGQKIGLVGNNGAGKTTFVKLLCRFYDPTEGDILVNGINLKNLDQKTWHQYLSLLNQDFTTYSFKVKEAIAISEGGKDLNEDRVYKAADKSTADKFINELKEKFENEIGVEFGGFEPSKGQRQKLALARTLYRERPILILDEPTSAIDAESEIEIFKHLDNLPDYISAIYISHDFSTIRRADRIIVVIDGEIAEDGPHEDLMKLNGTYAKLFTEQVEAYN